MGMNVRDRNTLTFYLANGAVATDLSAACATKWIATRGCRHASLGVGCTGTGSPNGVLTMEECNDSSSTSGAPYCQDGVTTSELLHPTGSAKTAFDTGIVTDADYNRFVWVPSSGGTGAVFTSESGVAGTLPVYILKE